MKVYLYPADEQGCGFYRMREPARVAAALGVETEIRDGLDAACRQSRDGELLKVESVEQLDCDVAIFQRPAKQEILQAIPLIQSQGVAVVVEIDDDLGAIPLDNPAWRSYHPASDSPLSWETAKACTKAADLVTVGTPTLTQRYGGVVLRNCIPGSVLDPNGVDRRLDGRSIGWAGAGEFHRGDFSVCGGGVAVAVRESGEKMRLGATNPDEIARWLGIPHNYSESVGYWGNPVGMHYGGINFNIGIVPLEASRFNHAKSWLKGLEYAALGIPFVASPAAEYREWCGVPNGTPPGCLLADRPKDWARQLMRLLNDAGLRAGIAAAAYDQACEWTLEKHALDWVETWERAVLMRKGIALHAATD